jgi:hypothetical protein
VDWSKITRPEELIPFMNRGGNIREIIATQVLDTHLKALAAWARTPSSCIWRCVGCWSRLSGA